MAHGPRLEWVGHGASFPYASAFLGREPEVSIALDNCQIFPYKSVSLLDIPR